MATPPCSASSSPNRRLAGQRSPNTTPPLSAASSPAHSSSELVRRRSNSGTLPPSKLEQELNFPATVHAHRPQQHVLAPLLQALTLFHPLLLAKYTLLYAGTHLRQVLRLLLAAAAVLVAVVLLGHYALGLGAAASLATAAALAAAYLVYFGRRPAPVLVVVQPISRAQAKPDFLVYFLRSHRQQVQHAVDKYGGVVFRGFNLDSVAEFERVLEAAGMEPTQFFGQAPRKQEPGWKYIFRNVAFEGASGSGGQGLLGRLQQRLGLVWSRTPAFLNAHNEMAYFSSEHHLASYGAFACMQAPTAGGLTLFSDGRRVKDRIEAAWSEVPVSMRWVLTRKQQREVPKQPTGSYIDYLLGNFELEGVPDQWRQTPSEGLLKDIVKRTAELHLDYEVDPRPPSDDAPGAGDVVVWSRWVSPLRRLPHSNEVSWWFNGNHASVGHAGPHHELLPFFFQFADGRRRRPTTAEVLDVALANWLENTYLPWQTGDCIIFNNQTVSHNASPGLGKRMIMPSFGNCFGSSD